MKNNNSYKTVKLKLNSQPGRVIFNVVLNEWSTILGQGIVDFSGVIRAQVANEFR